MRRRLLWILSLLIGLGVCGALLFVVFFDFDEAIETQKEAYLPKLTALLGRQVTAGPVEATFWPHLGGTLRDVQIAGPSSDAPPLLRIERVFLAVDSKEALYSWANEIRVVALTLTGIELNLTQGPDGVFAHEEIVRRLRARRENRSQPALDPKGDRFIRGLHLDSIKLNEGRVTIQHAHGGPTADSPLDNIHLEFTDVSRGNPYGVHLRATVGAGNENLSLNARLGPTVTTKAGPFTPVHHLELHVDHLHMGPIAPFLTKSHWDWREATIDGQWEMKDPHGLTPNTSIQGELRMGGLRIAGQKDGVPFEVSTKLRLRMDRVKGHLSIEPSALVLGGMRLAVRGSISEMHSATPLIDGVSIETKNLDLTRVLTYLPGVQAKLPEGVSLAGPASLSINGRTVSNTPVVTVRVDLGEAQLDIPEILHKKPGDPLGLRGSVRLREDDVLLDLDPLAWGPLEVTLAGPIDHQGTMTLNGVLGSNRPTKRPPAPETRPSLPLQLNVSGQMRNPQLTGPGAQALPSLAQTIGVGNRLLTAIKRSTIPQEKSKTATPNEGRP